MGIKTAPALLHQCFADTHTREQYSLPLLELASDLVQTYISERVHPLIVRPKSLIIPRRRGEMETDADKFWQLSTT